MASPTQLLIWTALPNGYDSTGTRLQVTAYLSPQMFNGGPQKLELETYQDFVNWPATISNPSNASELAITFKVQIGANAAVPATILSSPPWVPDQNRWPAIFGATTTYVLDRGLQEPPNPQQFASYGVEDAYTTIETIYQTAGVNNPLRPPVMVTNGAGELQLPPGSHDGPVLAGIEGAAALPAGTVNRYQNGVGKAATYWNRPQQSETDFFVPDVPIFDFHQGIAALGHYYLLQRLMGLAFDLTIPIPANYKSGTSTIRVLPTWTSGFTNGTTYQASPDTACLLTPTNFVAAPAKNSTDYANGMLDLADQSRFFITELDVDDGSLQVNAVSTALASIEEYLGNLGQAAQDQTYSLSLPTLRSTGPSIIWTGFADQMATQMGNQSGYLDAIAAWVANPVAHKLPTFHAPDLVQGHRIDVLPVDDPSPSWLSLHQRNGDYGFGPGAGGTQAPQYAALELAGADCTDEGFVTPGVSQNVNTTPADTHFYIHETIARWNGWSLSAPRIGGAVDQYDGFDSTPNAQIQAVPATDADGNTNPQLAAQFSVVPFLPKLRFGHRYQFRARGVDLACNSVPAASTDATTATPLFTYRRYQPVLPPVPVATDLLSPGQATLVVAVLNDMLGDTPAPATRWLFPPRVSELLAEEHGVFDGSFFQPNPNLPPDGSDGAYTQISDLDAGSLATITEIGTSKQIAEEDPAAGTFYLPDAYPALQVPYLPDPLSSGIAWLGLPGAQYSRTTMDYWFAGGGQWPNMLAELFTLEGGELGSQAATSFTQGSTSASSVRTLTLPPGDVIRLHVSSSITDPQLLGVYQWILANPPAGEEALYEQFALNGQLWQLSPYLTLMVAHATRLPVFAPNFGVLQAEKRTYGQTTVDLYDLSFTYDGASTSSVDVEAVWTDPIDNPSDPGQDPGPNSPTNAITTTADAFKVQVPDPNPELPTDNPGFMVAAPTTFALTEKPGVTHDIGDTHHHHVTYTPTGTSRFAEFFRPQRPIQPVQFQSAGQELTVTNSNIGLNAPSVDITTSDGTVLQQGEGLDYLVYEDTGVIEFTNQAYANTDLYVDYEPIVTLSGSSTSLHVLASAPPAMPKIDRIMPAWETRSAGHVSNSSALFTRVGGWLRVWLDRPWWSSGANEMLGVVCLPRQGWTTQPLTDPRSKLATEVGLDPISVADASLRTYVTPMTMGNWTPAPTDVPGITYAKPPAVPLIEDDALHYEIYPYPVQYDETNQQWFADVQMTFQGSALPPPGYFVRLGLVRFQPYAYAGAQVSRVSLATFAQPVVDRVVSIARSGPQAVRVTVAGPGYQGFRPANQEGPDGSVVEDLDNQFALRPYSDGYGTPVTSTMVVDIQLQDENVTGLPGDLAWYAATTPVALNPTFEGPIVAWTGTVFLPESIGSSTPMRARISELDYYTGSTAPDAVDTSLRRSFVAHVPIS